MHRSILIIAPALSSDAQGRAEEFADALESRGDRVTTVIANGRVSQSARRFDSVITLSPSHSAHLVGYILQRRGLPWIADLAQTDAGFLPAIRPRLVLHADALTCNSPFARRAIFDRLAASAAVFTEDRRGCLDPLLAALSAPTLPMTGPLRVLMVGPVNSQHMEDLALSLRNRGLIIRTGGVAWRGGLAASILPDNGIPVSVLTRPQPLWLRRLSRRFRPDLIHASWMPFAAGVAVAHVRTPLVAAAWGSDVFIADQRQQLQNRLAVRGAALTLADSQALVERLVELGAPRDRVALLNWGVDLDTFFPPSSPHDKRAVRESLGLPDRPLIFSPRGVKPLYNADVIVEAFSRVLEATPNAHLVLKHQGEEPDLGPLANRERIHFIGRVPYERIPDYFRAADVCVSIPSTDSSPRSVWEAMACGCSCVVSDLPWVRELIEPGVHALVASIDAGSVADAITRLLADHSLAAAIQRNARDLVKEHRNQAVEIDRLGQLYEGVAARTPSHA
jgi:glycosyltransferase involved in cell wall biosynthesis